MSNITVDKQQIDIIEKHRPVLTDILIKLAEKSVHYKSVTINTEVGSVTFNVN